MGTKRVYRIDGSTVVEKDGYYVDYSDNLWDSDSPATAIINTSGGAGSDKYLILNGCHLKKLARLETYKECVAYFKENIGLKNRNSDTWEEEIIFDTGRLIIRTILKY